MQLYEKYRPKTLEDVRGQDKAVGIVRRLLAQGGAGGRAWWFSGPSGAGKSTLGRIVAGTIADDWCTVTVVGRELTASGLARIWDDMRTYGSGNGGRALIVDESHGLSGPTIEKLLGCLESIPSHVCVVFTTTKEGQAGLFADHDDAHPLLSRCNVIGLTNQGLAAAFAPMLKAGAEAEGLDGQDVSEYVKPLRRPDVKNNCRAAWQLIQQGAMLPGGGA